MELAQLEQLKDVLEQVAKPRAQHLVEAHERFAEAVKARCYRVIRPVLPMDVLGLCVLLPGPRV